MYKIKHIPEDFIVDELIELNVNAGDYKYYKLTKKNWNTIDIIEKLADSLGIPSKKIGFAGNKDKNAITTQYISICFIPVNKVLSFKLKNIDVEYVGSGKERINLGDNYGNHFNIIVRNIIKKKHFKNTKIKNLFDQQRFGKDNVNILYGKLILQRRYNELCRLLSMHVNNNDYVNALRKYGIKKLRFYIHAYQSYIWNELASTKKSGEIPIVGFLTEYKDVINMLKKDNININDFIFRDFPELSSEGANRELWIKPENFAYKWEDDEIFKNKYKCILSFDLVKGGYATIVVKTLFN